MEWFEVLFQQVCAHLIVRSRTAHHRREDCRLIADQGGLHELVDSYGKDLKVVFDPRAVSDAIDAGASAVLLVHVRENLFTRPAQELIKDRDVRQVLASSIEVDAVSPESSGHRFDVIFCRPSR